MNLIIKIFSYDFFSKTLISIVGISLIGFMNENEYAKYTIALSFAGVIFQCLSGFFDRFYLVNKINLPGKTWCAQVLLLQIVVSFLCTLFIMFVVRDIEMSIGVFFLLVGYFYFQSRKVYLQGEQDFKKFNFIEVLKSTIFFVICMSSMFFINVQNYLYYIVIQSLTLLFVAVFYFYDFKIKEGALGVYSSVRNVLKGIPKKDTALLGYVVCTSFFSQLGIFMSEYCLSSTDVSSYGASMRYYSILTLFVGAVNLYMLPVMSSAEGSEKINSLIKMSLKLSLIVLPVFVAAFLISPLLIPLLDQGKYPDSVRVFQVLCGAAYVNLVFSPLVNYLMKVKVFLYLFICSLVALVIFIVLGVFLAGKYGIIGLATSQFVAYSFMGGGFFFGFKFYKQKFHAV